MTASQIASKAGCDQHLLCPAQSFQTPPGSHAWDCVEESREYTILYLCCPVLLLVNISNTDGIPLRKDFPWFSSIWNNSSQILDFWILVYKYLANFEFSFGKNWILEYSLVQCVLQQCMEVVALSCLAPQFYCDTWMLITGICKHATSVDIQKKCELLTNLSD